MSDKVSTVDGYLSKAPPAQRAALDRVRRAIKAAAPQAEETISYGIPLYKHHGHLVGFGAFKKHCSLFVTDSAVREQFADELDPFEVKHTAIHFSPEKPLPDDLVKRIVRARVAENEAKTRG